MLDALWLFALAVLDMLGLWFHVVQLTLASTLALLISASLVVTRRWCLAGVTYRRVLSDHQADFGEQVTLSVEVCNLKPLPMAWLHISDNVPATLPIEGGLLRPEQPSSYRYLLTVLAMLPYEGVVRQMRVRCLHRGEHTFGHAYVESGDYLGLVRHGFLDPKVERLLVLPKILPLIIERTLAPPNFGNRAARHPFLTDPLRIIGAREYTPTDPFRMIDWRATARAAKLMVPQLEPSLTPVLDLVIDVTGPGDIWRAEDSDEVEFAISIAASVAAHALASGWAVGVRSNGTVYGAPLDIAAARSPAQLSRIILALTRLVARPGLAIGTLLRRHARAGGDALLLLVTAALTPACIEAAQTCRRHRRFVRILHAANALSGGGGALAGIQSWTVPYEPQWWEREALVIRG